MNHNDHFNLSDENFVVDFQFSAQCVIHGENENVLDSKLCLYLGFVVFSLCDSDFFSIPTKAQHACNIRKHIYVQCLLQMQESHSFRATYNAKYPFLFSSFCSITFVKKKVKYLLPRLKNHLSGIINFLHSFGILLKTSA